MARSGKYWDDNLCSEHNGTIRNFASAELELKSIEECEAIFKRETTDLIRAAKTVASTVAKSLVPSPVGAALLALKRTTLGNSYLGEIDHFSIRKIKTGNRHALIFINGFDSQGETDVDDWTTSLTSHFARHTWYHLDWEATSLPKIKIKKFRVDAIADSDFGAPAIGKPGTRFWESLLAYRVGIADNPWHVSMDKAEATGIMLAEVITRTKGWRFTLAGHSLGARVIFFALKSLSAQTSARIEDVYLLGGAVGGSAKDESDWSSACQAVKGDIYNCYSKHDHTLRCLYQGFNAMLSQPIGCFPIHTAENRIHSVDCSEHVSGHTNWKKAFGTILGRLHPQPGSEQS